MPDMNDFHEFQSTSGGGGGAVALMAALPWILAGPAILYIIGKLAR